MISSSSLGGRSTSKRTIRARSSAPRGQVKSPQTNLSNLECSRSIPKMAIPICSGGFTSTTKTDLKRRSPLPRMPRCPCGICPRLRSRPPIDARCQFSFRQLISMRTGISFSSWALQGANLFYVIEGRNIVRCNRQLKSQTVQPLAVGIAERLLFPKLPLDNVRRRLVIDLQQLVEPQSVPEFPRQSKGRGSPFCRDRELRLRENECNLTTESFAVLAIYYRGKYTHCLSFCAPGVNCITVAISQRSALS